MLAESRNHPMGTCWYLRLHHLSLHLAYPGPSWAYLHFSREVCDLPLLLSHRFLSHSSCSPIPETVQDTPNPLLLLYFIPQLTDAICLLYVSSNCSIISGFLYLRVVCTWHSFMQWSTCTQTSRDTLRESRFHMNMNLIEISLGQSSQPYLLLWSSLLMVKWYVNYASSFAHFSS